MGTVTVDESPSETHLTACIKIDDVCVVNCTDWWVDKMTNHYSTPQIEAAETAILDHVENNMGFEMTPQLESDLRDAITYVGTLG